MSNSDSDSDTEKFSDAETNINDELSISSLKENQSLIDFRLDLKLNFNSISERCRTIIKKLDEQTNIFISGIGGCGKSYLLREVYFYLSRRHNTDEVAITSTTGISSYNLDIKNCTTIHSWSGIILPAKIPDDINGFLSNLCLKVKKNKKLRTRWEKTKYLLIDEISMLGANYIEVLDTIARKIRGVDKPMGGIQVIFSGDFLQLPPVGDDLCFLSPVWKEMKFVYYKLMKAYRFQNEMWIERLKRVRVGEMTAEDITFFKSCVNKKNVGSVVPTRLFSVNKKVDEINEKEMDKIKEIGRMISCVDTKVVKSFLKEIVPIECTDKERGMLDQVFNVKQRVILKKGAQVMLLINLDIENGLVNGSRGVITDFIPDHENNEYKVRVKFKDGEHDISNFNFEYEEDSTPVTIYTRRMIPLSIAFAYSIHKCQGSSLDLAEIDCGRDVFEYNQTYVALSRVRNEEGLYLTQFDISKVKPHPEGLKMEKMINKVAKLIE